MDVDELKTLLDTIRGILEKEISPDIVEKLKEEELDVKSFMLLSESHLTALGFKMQDRMLLLQFKNNQSSLLQSSNEKRFSEFYGENNAASSVCSPTETENNTASPTYCSTGTENNAASPANSPTGTENNAASPAYSPTGTENNPASPAYSTTGTENNAASSEYSPTGTKNNATSPAYSPTGTCIPLVPARRGPVEQVLSGDAMNVTTLDLFHKHDARDPNVQIEEEELALQHSRDELGNLTNSGKVLLQEKHTDVNTMLDLSSKGHIQLSERHIPVSEGHIQASEGHIQSSEGDIQASETSEGHIQASEEHTQASEGHIQGSEKSEGHIQVTEGHIFVTEASESHIQASEGHNQASEEHIQASEGHIQANEEHIQISEGHIHSKAVQKFKISKALVINVPVIEFAVNSRQVSTVINKHLSTKHQNITNVTVIMHVSTKKLVTVNIQDTRSLQ